MRRLPPGSNVGTQLRARRAAKTRAQRAEQAQREAVQRKLRGPQQLAFADARCLVRGAGPDAVCVPARDLGSRRCGTLGPAARDHRRRQDLRGVVRAARRACSRERQHGARRAAPAVDHADARARRRHRARAAGAARGARLALGRRGAHRRHRRRRRARARRSACPTVLVTTPESLSLLLTRADAREQFAQLDMVVVDEWHELLGSKRGVQVQLALARLRALREPAARCVWGLSATLGNLEHAREVLLGAGRAGVHRARAHRQALRRRHAAARRSERFPWAGHLGIQMLQPVVREIDAHAHDARLHQHALAGRDLVPGAARGAAGLGRADRAAPRLARPRGARLGRARPASEGACKAVVCTSSLDLGVDFLPVERVLQIGSAKGVARLLQRAGRSGHAPGACRA